MLAGDRSRSVGSYPTTNLPIMPVPGSVVVCAGMSFVLLLIFSTTNETEITEGVEGPGSAEEMLTVLQRVLEESAPVLVTARHDAEERRTNIRLREEDDAAYRAALEADQVEGARSPEEMLKILQSALEESSPVLVTAWHDAEEWRTNIRLREERDAAYRVALEADQARAQPRKEELAREAERKRKEEEEAREREAGEAAEKEAALARLRQEKALSLGAEPEKRPDVVQVLVQFPTGERRDWRFHNTATIQSLYDYVGSLGCLEVESYCLA